MRIFEYQQPHVSEADPRAGAVEGRPRRTRVPDKPNYPLSLWSIMKNCIGELLAILGNGVLGSIDTTTTNPY